MKILTENTIRITENTISRQRNIRSPDTKLSTHQPNLNLHLGPISCSFNCRFKVSFREAGKNGTVANKSRKRRSHIN